MFNMCLVHCASSGSSPVSTNYAAEWHRLIRQCLCSGVVRSSLTPLRKLILLINHVEETYVSAHPKVQAPTDYAIGYMIDDLTRRHLNDLDRNLRTKVKRVTEIFLKECLLSHQQNKKDAVFMMRRFENYTYILPERINNATHNNMTCELRDELGILDGDVLSDNFIESHRDSVIAFLYK